MAWGGITTLEDKSLGCTQKSGTSEVCDVLFDGDALTARGLNLLNGPGNDMVAVTNLAAAGCHLVLFTTGRGTPDWIIEITSPSTERLDCGIKLFKYRSAGVGECWMVNPKLHTVTVYDFEYNEKTKQYSFDDNIPSCIFQDFSIHITDLLK